MTEKGLEEFHHLVLKLRSEAISNISNHIHGKFKISRSREMTEAYKKIENSPSILESYFLPEIVDETIVILLQLLDASTFDVRYMPSEKEGGASLFDATESLSANYEFDWLPQIKIDK